MLTNNDIIIFLHDSEIAERFFYWWNWTAKIKKLHVVGEGSYQSMFVLCLSELFCASQHNENIFAHDN